MATNSYQLYFLECVFSRLLSTIVISEIKQLVSYDMQNLVRTNEISQERNENNFVLNKQHNTSLFDMMLSIKYVWIKL